MNRYEPAMPRATFGLIAVAMTAITIGAMVVLPAKLDSVNAAQHTVVATSAKIAPVGAGVSSARVDARNVVNREEHFTTRVRRILRRILAKEKP